MTSTVKEEKNALRTQYKALREELPVKEKTLRDEALCRYAASLASFRFSKYVLLYSATEDEISLDFLAEASLEKGKIIAYPRCDTEKHTMQFHIVSSPDELIPGAYGIKEPSPDSPVYTPENFPGGAVCFVPGLLFDRSGYRLGYGKGYYDRFLSSFVGNSIGVVYSDFILPKVPRGRHDMKVNALITEKNVINIKVENEN